MQITVPAPSAPQIVNPTTNYTIMQGEDFSFAILATNSPTSYAVGTLPDGLDFDAASGVISGTPTTPGTYGINLYATNAGGTGTALLVLSVQGAEPVIPSLVLKATVPQADYESGQNGQFVIYLTEPTTLDLIVLYTLTGNAVGGRDYKKRPGFIVIPAGSTYGIVRIIPTGRHTTVPTHNVLMTLIGGNFYEVRTRRAIRVTVTNP